MWYNTFKYLLMEIQEVVDKQRPKYVNIYFFLIQYEIVFIMKDNKLNIRLNADLFNSKPLGLLYKMTS